MPVISDAFYHAFAEARHLALVHAHDDDHHLDHELAEAGQDHNHEQNHKLPKGEDLLQIHLSIQHNLVDLKPDDFNRDYPSLCPEKLPLTFLAEQISPP